MNVHIIVNGSLSFQDKFEISVHAKTKMNILLYSFHRLICVTLSDNWHINPTSLPRNKCMADNITGIFTLRKVHLAILVAICSNNTLASCFRSNDQYIIDYLTAFKEICHSAVSDELYSMFTLWIVKISSQRTCIFVKFLGITILFFANVHELQLTSLP